MNSGLSDYQAVMEAPFGVLGIRARSDVLTHIDFLPRGEKPQAPNSRIAAAVVDQLSAYFRDPQFVFSVPLELHGTPFQRRVWEAMLDIPSGQTCRYGEVASRIHSGARAVGAACGANPIPIIVPCHRIVAVNGLGGFNNHPDFYPIKEWLLRHEGARW